MEFTSVWHEAGDSAEQAEQAGRMAYATAATADQRQFLYASTSAADFEHRAALVGGTLSAVSTAHGFDEQALMGEYRREVALVIEAKQASWDHPVASSAQPCADCDGMGSVPAGGGEHHRDVDNGYVKCPSCKGSGADGGKKAAAKTASVSRPEAPLTYEASMDLIKQALEEGQPSLNDLAAEEDSLANDEGAEQPSISGNEAFNEGNYVHSDGAATQVTSSQQAATRPFDRTAAGEGVTSPESYEHGYSTGENHHDQQRDHLGYGNLDGSPDEVWASAHPDWKRGYSDAYRDKKAIADAREQRYNASLGSDGAPDPKAPPA